MIHLQFGVYTITFNVCKLPVICPFLRSYFSTLSLLNSFPPEEGENPSAVHIWALCQKCDADVDGFFSLTFQSSWGHLCVC